jgi:hypothetical protein
MSKGNNIRFSTLHPDGRETNVRSIPQDAVRQCPFFILVASHYRDDGSCKCNDPAHRKMMKEEWGYTDSDFLKGGIAP